MKTNNRQMIKVVEHEVWVQYDNEKGKPELVWKEQNDFYFKKERATGNTREIERPMTDKEYIEYLEETKKEVWDCYHECEKHNSLLYKQRTTLEKENKELKGRLKLYE